MAPPPPGLIRVKQRSEYSFISLLGEKLSENPVEPRKFDIEHISFLDPAFNPCPFSRSFNPLAMASSILLVLESI